MMQTKEIDFTELVLDNVRLNVGENRKLLPLQFQVYEKLKRNDYVFVYDEVGCGKTIEAGIAIHSLVCDKENPAKNIMIIAPNQLLYNWYSELLEKFGLEFKIIEGTKDYLDIYDKNLNMSETVKELCNYCIVANMSTGAYNSCLALDRLKTFQNICWDLIVIDEGHDNKNESSKRAESMKTLKSKRVLFMSATPIMNTSDDYTGEKRLVETILKNGNEKFKELELDIYNNPEELLKIDFDIPYTRSFKEIMNDKGEFKSRDIKIYEYEVDTELKKSIYSKYRMEHSRRGCIWLYRQAFFDKEDWKQKHNIYQKLKYTKEDVFKLLEIDKKLEKLIEILENCVKDNERVIIFCNRIETVDYLKKALSAEYEGHPEKVEAIHGKNYTQQERLRRISELSNMKKGDDNAKIVILSHKIGSQGINFPDYSHVINYELPDRPGDLEQRFGRIDRINNLSDVLTMYVLLDKCENYWDAWFGNAFDSTIWYRIAAKMNEVLSILPSKNLLQSSKELSDAIYKLLVKGVEYYEKLKEENFVNDEILGQANIILELANEKKTDEIFSKEKTVEKLGEYLTKWLRILEYNETKVGELGEIRHEDLEEKVSKCTQKNMNRISFWHGGREKAYDFVLLNKIITESKDYRNLCQLIKNKENKLEDYIECLKVKLEEYGCLAELIKEISKEIKEYPEQLWFSCIYGVWLTINRYSEEEKLELVDLIGEFNRQII